jgi:hypothetical protein
VTSTPSGINCAGAGAGWSDGGCSGTGPCMLTLYQNTEVQGIFTTCTGWRQEQLPFTVRANLNGSAGTMGSNVYVRSWRNRRCDSEDATKRRPPGATLPPSYQRLGCYSGQQIAQETFCPVIIPMPRSASTIPHATPMGGAAQAEYPIWQEFLAPGHRWAPPPTETPPLVQPSSG